MEEEKPLLESKTQTRKEKGGFWTLPFITGLDSIQKMTTYGLMPNMIVYLIGQYHMEMTGASNILFLWSSATNFLPIIWAMIADSFLGRYYTIGFGSFVCLLGTILLWTTAICQQARPPSCSQSNTSCSSSTVFQVMYLFSSLILVSVGAGAINSSSLAFGANQLEKGGSGRISAVKESYFNWCYASYTIATLVAFTIMVYIQDKMGWGVGFLVPAIMMLFGTVSFILASPLYIKMKSKTSLLTGLIQVVVASYRNRHVKLPSNCANIMYHYISGSNLVCPSEKLRFLNKACIIKDPENELNHDRSAINPWRLCTVDQVEELKALVRIIPIWSTGMIMHVNVSQVSFPVLQANSMNRQITPDFTIPGASFSVFTILFAMLWVVLYDRVFLPVASRIKGRPVHINAKTRMGLGIFLSSLSVLVTAIVENFRRALATRQGYPESGKQLSAMWLLPHHFLSGSAEAANMIAQNEFYFSEFPRSMLSIASSLKELGMSLASLLAILMLNATDIISKALGHESWITTDINKGHYDYYYFVLAALGFANFMYFIVCSKAYGPLKTEMKMAEQEES